MVSSTQLRARGFSLAELVCIVVIVGILAGIATPRLGGVLAHQRVNAAAGRVVSDLALARHWARQTSEFQVVVFDVANHRYDMSSMPDPSRPGTTYAVDLDTEPYGAELDAVIMDGGQQVQFDQFGTTDLTTNGTIRLSVGKYLKTVLLDARSGYAEVQE